MVKLIAVAPGDGTTFVETIRTIWDEGNAFTVVDPRLPEAETHRLLAVIEADVLVDEAGLHHRLSSAKSKPALIAGDALVVMTSGSTGQPKGVVHTHHSIAASAEATSDALNVDPATDGWLACLPLSHIGGLSVVLRAIHTGTPVQIQPTFDPKRVEAAGQDRATLVSLVTKALHQVDASVFRSILIGGAAPPANLASNVIPTYGMTETGSGIVYGTTVLDNVDIVLADAEVNQTGQHKDPSQGKDPGKNKVGEICVRGPMLMRCYRDGSDGRDASGWYRTGDYGQWGQDGRLIVSGRIDRAITTGGEKVWPDRLEPVLRELTGVTDAVACGATHPDWGQQVVAILQIEDGAEPPDIQTVRSWVKEELPPWYAPQRLKIVAQLPRTATGKIQRDALQQIL